MRPKVIEAHSVELREQVFRLRYDVYVTEMEMPLSADHARRRCTDAIDDTAVILAAVERDGPVGRARLWMRTAQGASHGAGFDATPPYLPGFEPQAAFQF